MCVLWYYCLIIVPELDVNSLLMLPFDVATQNKKMSLHFCHEPIKQPSTPLFLPNTQAARYARIAINHVDGQTVQCGWVKQMHCSARQDATNAQEGATTAVVQGVRRLADEF